MLSNSFDCVAVPLPESFQVDVEQAILSLPTPSAVFQRDRIVTGQDWRPNNAADSFNEVPEGFEEGESFDEDDFDDDDIENRQLRANRPMSACDRSVTRRDGRPHFLVASLILKPARLFHSHACCLMATR